MSLPKECPIGPRKRKSPKRDLEGTVVRECLHYLRHCPSVVYVERRNTGAVQFQDGGFIRFGAVGAADIWCLLNVPIEEWDIPADQSMRLHPERVAYESYCKIHVEVECKRADGKGRQSKAQKEFQEFCDNHDIPYLLVTSARELEEKIRAILLDK